jgi:hypothetical protein
MINMDHSIYKELAARIEVFHDKGFSWEAAQRAALNAMILRYGWRPS